MKASAAHSQPKKACHTKRKETGNARANSGSVHFPAGPVGHIANGGVPVEEKALASKYSRRLEPEQAEAGELTRFILSVLADETASGNGYDAEAETDRKNNRGYHEEQVRLLIILAAPHD